MHPVTLSALAGMISIIEQSLAQMKGVLAAASQVTAFTPQVQQRDNATRAGDETLFIPDEGEEARALDKLMKEVGISPLEELNRD